MDVFRISDINDAVATADIAMGWTTNLIVQIVAGFVGAHFVATALPRASLWLGGDTALSD
jgi:hypothetical protein